MHSRLIYIYICHRHPEVIPPDEARHCKVPRLVQGYHVGLTSDVDEKIHDYNYNLTRYRPAAGASQVAHRESQAGPCLSSSAKNLA
jgi:hypothetical protein